MFGGFTYVSLFMPDLKLCTQLDHCWQDGMEQMSDVRARWSNVGSVMDDHL